MTRWRNYTQKQTREAQRALHKAWDLGVLDPLYFYPKIFDWAPPRPDPEVARLLAREPPPPKRNDQITDQLNDPAFDTRAQQYQDTSFFHAGPFVPLTVYEVARFITAGNQTGFVKLAWTFARVSDGAGGEVELDPRDPFAVQNAAGLAPFQVVWFLRLHQGQFQRTIPPPFIGPFATFGGYGFAPLNQWNDYRFQWGRTQANVFFLVPQYHKLSLCFMIDVEPNEILQVGGRLQGYTQPIDVRPTGWNVSHGWS